MTDLLDTSAGDLVAALDALEGAVALVQAADRGGLAPAEELALLGRLERVRRRLDHGSDLTAGHLDASAAFSLDGHKTAKGALEAIGRLSGAEAHGRVQASRALRRLPLVEAAYDRGEIPTEHVRAIAHTVSNPRVAEWVPGADPIFAHHATILGYDDFVAALRQWEALADADGADQASERSHQRRNASLQASAIDGSFRLDSNHGALQGAAMAEIFERLEPRRRLPPGSAPRAGRARVPVGRLRRPGTQTSRSTTGTRSVGEDPPTSGTPMRTAGSTTAPKNAGSGRSAVRTGTGPSTAPTTAGPSRHPSDPSDQHRPTRYRRAR